MYDGVSTHSNTSPHCACMMTCMLVFSELTQFIKHTVNQLMHLLALSGVHLIFLNHGWIRNCDAKFTVVFNSDRNEAELHLSE